MAKRHVELTAKIVQKAAVGETKKKIADDLGITPTTVQNHLRPLRTELNARISNGENPAEAWEDILISIFIGAGTASAIIAWMKILDELRTAVKEKERLFYSREG